MNGIRCLSVGACVALLWMVGCSGEYPTPEMAEVKGKITYKGKPLPGGTVVFQTTDGKNRGVAPIMANGTYSMKSPLGEVKAAVVTRNPSAESMSNREKRPAVREVHMPTNVDPKSLPPEKYERFETSGLSYTIKAGTNAIDIPLD
jgi:hypothetical protein